MLSKSPLRVRRRRFAVLLRSSAIARESDESLVLTMSLGGGGSFSQMARSISARRVDEMKNGPDPHNNL
jgi:hypothetical protein